MCTSQHLSFCNCNFISISHFFSPELRYLSKYSVWLETGQTGLDSRKRQRIFFSSLCVQTSSGAHPASCPEGTGVLSPGLKRGRGVTLTTHTPLDFGGQ
jgi:hypothetical protein